MRTETITRNIYEFHELSPEAKQKAKDDHDACCGYTWGKEAEASITALGQHFGATMSEWVFDYTNGHRSYVHWDNTDTLTIREVTERLGQLGSYDPQTLKGTGECKLTGYCMDEPAIDGFRYSFQFQGGYCEECGHEVSGGHIYDINRHLQAAFQQWFKACVEDYQGQYTDEAFGETCTANNYEFYGDGSMVCKQ